MADFDLASDSLALPPGAWARTHRRRLRHGGRTVLALTQGAHRPYVFPLMTPAGYPVTAEAPADHPHHASLWIGADHVHALQPTAAGVVEECTYNFYTDETFQGRAPGRLVERRCDGAPDGAGGFRFTQAIDWLGPAEWAAAAGRLVVLEERVTRVAVGEGHYRLDVASTITAGERAVRLGPTRHAFFNVRVADGLMVANGGTVLDDRGRVGGAAISGEGARWVDFSGPVGGGHVAGVTVIAGPLEGREPFWFVADWGVVTVGPFREQALELEPSRSFTAHHAVIVHDGDADAAGIERLASNREQVRR